MGYTHYIHQKPNLDINTWTLYTNDVRAILANADVPLAFEYNQTEKPPFIDDELVRFNGHGEDGHEVFYFQRNARIIRKNEINAFTFCKTDHKPYDAYVVACLVLASYWFGDDIKFNSDGDLDELQEGVNIVNRYLKYGITLKEFNNVPEHYFYVEAQVNNKKSTVTANDMTEVFGKKTKQKKVEEVKESELIEGTEDTMRLMG